MLIGVIVYAEYNGDEILAHYWHADKTYAKV
jgi:hypothetical protein